MPRPPPKPPPSTGPRTWSCPQRVDGASSSGNCSRKARMNFVETTSKVPPNLKACFFRQASLEREQSFLPTNDTEGLLSFEWASLLFQPSPRRLSPSSSTGGAFSGSNGGLLGISFLGGIMGIDQVVLDAGIKDPKLAGRHGRQDMLSVSQSINTR